MAENMSSNQYLAVDSETKATSTSFTLPRIPLPKSVLTVLISLLGGVVAGLALLNLPLKHFVLLAGGITALTLTFIYPKVSGGIFILILLLVGPPGGFWPLVDINVVQGLPSLTWSFMLVCIAIYTFRLYLIDSGHSIVSLRPLALYAAVVATAYVTGRVANWNPNTLRTDLFNMIYPMLSFYLIRNLFRNPVDARRMLWVFFVATTMMATILSAAYLAGYGESFVLGRGFGVGRLVTLDSAALMSFTAMGLLAAARLAQPDATPGTRIGLALCAGPMAFALIFSFRRTEWLGTLAGIGLLWWLSTRFERRRLLTFGLLALALTVIIAAFSGGHELAAKLQFRGSTLVDRNHSPNRHHLLEPLQALRDLRQRPVLGMGLGGEHGPIPEFPRDTVPRHVVHNTWVYIWMKLGLPGLLFLAWMTLRYARKLRARMRSGLPAASRAELLAMISILPLWLAQSMTAPIPWYARQSSLMAALAALALALAADQSEQASGVTTEAINQGENE